MRFKVAGNKKDVLAVVVKSADTITIPSGAPVFLAANGTNDGLAVVSANNLATALLGNFFGFATADIAPSAYGESQVFGFFETARLRVTTRADSTSTWASYAAGSIGQPMASFVSGTGGAAGSTMADHAMSISAATAVFSVNQQIRLMATYASQTTQASSLVGGLVTDASCTASVTSVKVFVRCM